jgi:hypothetical protein
MKFRIVFPVFVAAVALAGCDKKSSGNLAPSATPLAAPTAAAGQTALAIDTAGSKVTFLMNAPIEKIFGEAGDASKGDVFVNPKDVGKTTALIKVDLDKLVLFQQKREDEKSEFGEKVKSDKQNEHARNWLEIGSDAPADVREKNRWAEFKIEKLENVSTNDITTLTGAERKVTATAVGDFRLHGRAAKKSAKIEATFKFEGDKLTGVSVKSVDPVNIGLDEFDVRPREAFGKLAKGTLDTLGSKVAKEAPVVIEFNAKAAGAGAGTGTGSGTTTGSGSY